MSKYFIDTEFLEGTQKTLFGESKPTIELISIGVVCEDGREYYAISKDFNLKEAWNRYDLVSKKNLKPSDGDIQEKVYWIRDNVLFRIYTERISGDMRNHFEFTYRTMKWLIYTYGKTNRMIAEDIKSFCVRKKITEKVIDRQFYCSSALRECAERELSQGKEVKMAEQFTGKETNIEFYGYYCDYDWVVFCWLFGKMIDLPNGFPMYCIDLQQIFDEKMKTFTWERLNELVYPECKHDVYDYLRRQPDANVSASLKKSHIFPKQTNEHHALMDARWTKQLYEFLDKI